MASYPNPTSINPYDLAERRGISGERNFPSINKTDSPMPDGEGSFTASDLFCQRMGTMINRQDVQSMLEKQAETLAKFEKINAKFGRFNDLSAARYSNLNQQLRNHTKMLVDMKKDLDSVFRRIRILKTKLTKHYGPAFHATSANIQKLEEELGASIENEDASVSTLTENKELNLESQGIEVKNTEEEQLKPRELPSQDSSLSFGEKTTMNKSNDYAVENRTAPASEFQIQENDDDFSGSISIAQDNEFMSRTVANEAVIKTVGTNNMGQSVKDTVLLETSGIRRKEGTCDTLQTVDTNDKSQTMLAADTTEIVDTVGKTETLESGDTTETADTSRKTQTLDNCSTSEIVDISHKTQTLDTCDN